MTERCLTDGSPVPADGSHATIDPTTGQQRGYVILTPEERAKGFVKPVRFSYIHAWPSELDRKGGCGGETRMGIGLAETYARDPKFYSGTYCVHCGSHFPLSQFVWSDGEPLDPSQQQAWADGAKERRRTAMQERIRGLEKRVADTLAELNQLRTEL